MVYVITAYRWGQVSNHSYVVGISKTMDAAASLATREEDARGGKYRCGIDSCGELVNEGELVALPDTFLCPLPDPRHAHQLS